MIYIYIYGAYGIYGMYIFISRHAAWRSDAMGSVDESLEAAYTGRGAPQGLGRG